MLQKIKDFEELGDYSEDLLYEISKDIDFLNKYPESAKLGLAKLNVKIDLAKKKGLNTNKIEEQVVEFREKIFLKSLKTRTDEIALNPNFSLTNIKDLEKEYFYLKDKLRNSTNIDENMEFLKAVIDRASIYIMIIDIQKSGGVSSYSPEGILQKITEVKEKGINVDDLEDLLFEQMV